jgi:hypothetical protein
MTSLSGSRPRPMTIYINDAVTIPAAVLTKAQRKITQTSFALVGTGWRSSVYLRMAYLMPERLRVTGVMARRPESGAVVERDWGLPSFRNLDELLSVERPDFVILSVPWPVTPDLTRRLVEREIPLLDLCSPRPRQQPICRSRTPCGPMLEPLLSRSPNNTR